MPHKLHSIEIDVDSFGVDSEVIIPDCISAGLNNSPQIDAIIGAAKIQPEHVALVAQKIVGNFATYALKTAIDATTLKPLCIATDTEPGVKFYLADFDDCGTVKSGSVHRSLLVSSGAVVPRRLTCDHQGHAQLFYDVVVIKESANDAIVISDVAALPTVGNAGERWTLGDTSVGGKTLSEYTSLEIDFGNEVQTRGSQSDIWDTHIEVRTHSPRITLTGIDPEWFSASNVPITGLACTHANTTIYLRKRAGDGTGFVADATAEHVKFTAAGVAVVQNAFTGDANRFTETSLIITGYEDSSDNDPLIVTTASAIT